MARTECTPELVAAICSHIQCGAPFVVAAQAEGIGKTTLYRWHDEGDEAEQKRDRGEELTEKEGARLHLRESVVRAKALFETGILAELRHSEDAKKDRALTWLLERIRREQYGIKIDLMVREQAASHLLRILSERLPADVVAAVAAALQDQTGDED